MKKLFTVALVLALVHLHPGAARAQQIPFLNELLARLEAFARLSAERGRAGGNAAEIEALRKRGEEAFRTGQIAALIEIFGEGMARLQGKPWDDRARFANSLTLEPDRLVIEPNQDIQVSLARMYPVDAGKAFAAPLTVSFEIHPGPADPEGEAPRLTAPVLIARQLAVAETVTSANRRILLPDGAYWMVARVEAGGQPVAEVRKPIYAIGDFSDRVRVLTRQAAAIQSSSDAKVRAVAPLVATPAFQLQRLAPLHQSRGEYNINPIAELDRVAETLEALGKGENPFAAERGEVERAYAASDNQMIPYRLYVPKSYDAARATPLVVLLHGALGDETTYFSGLYDPAVIKGEAEKRGWILAAVNGRGRLSSYQGPGEEDVFKVIEAVRRDYRIDPARIYLTGHSLGGGGTWMVAGARPDLFAAIAPVAGGGPVEPEVTRTMLEKVKGLPVYVAHGARDSIVPPERSRAVAEAAKKLGMNVQYNEVAEGDHINIVALTFPAILDFFAGHAKKAAAQ